MAYSGLTDAISDIQATGQAGSLDTTPSITYFAYVDGTSSPADLTINNFVGWTPLLETGKSYTAASGAALVITRRGDQIYVNGDRIVRPNVPTKNGVVHFVQTVS